MCAVALLSVSYLEFVWGVGSCCAHMVYAISRKCQCTCCKLNSFCSCFLQEIFPHPDTLRLDVIVHQARNLKKTKMEKCGFAAFSNAKFSSFQFVSVVYSWLLDPVLDPYVRLEVTQPLQKASGIAVQHSTCKEDNEYPVWEEKFSFLLDTTEGRGDLLVTIWDSNYLFDSQWSKSVAVDLSDVEEGEEFQFRTLTVHVSIWEASDMHA